MTADILRDKFLSFFKAKKHKIVESDSLVPVDDPTVLFTPAGMNQFKKQFLGQLTGFSRAASSQRCLRTDDLDKVGKTSAHHTLFEMLGNFSFGDYFKKEAITWAWEFLLKELKLPSEKLWVSVYKDDDEAYLIWKDLVKIPENRIVKLGDKDNFWPAEAKEKGPNGPCGPCSEIFYDFGKDTGCGKPDCSPACSCGRFVEIWNLVFTQFNRKEGGALEPLPKKNIDTGMGLERLTAVMQGAKNNFETELFQPLIKAIASNVKEEDKLNKEFLYAISDHLRAIVFSIYDGVLPSNEARGYIVRKLIRKSVLHLGSMGIKKPFLYKLVPILAQVMSRPYPELKKRQENISEIILAEEKNFISSLESSDILLEEKFKGVMKNPDPELAGKLTFVLYDTYGIPLELVSDWLKKQGVSFSEEAFKKEMQEQKTRSKEQSAMKGDVFAVKELFLKLKATLFLGYRQDKAKAKIQKIVKNDQEAKKITQGDTAELVLDQTPFYAESGGQVGDAGLIIKGKNIFEVIETRKVDNIYLHIGRVKQGAFKKAEAVEAAVDSKRRAAIARNHTATHLLQAALRKILGEHVQQQGSLVAPERLRFDFTHFKDVNPEELSRIEEEVYKYVIENHVLATKVMTVAEAKKTGALAFFGEKYGSKVRVVAVSGISSEFCGGTHLDSTGEIGLFKIIHEGSVASGVRRIEAVTGEAAYNFVREKENILEGLSELIGVPEEKLNAEIQKRLAQAKEFEKQLNSQRLNAAKNASEKFIGDAQDIKGVKIIAQVLENADMNSLRKSIDLLKEKSGNNTIVVLGAKQGERALLVMGLTSDLTQRGFDASALLGEIAKLIGGSGGGRKDFAQAGGSEPGNFPQAFAKLKEIVEAKL